MKKNYLNVYFSLNEEYYSFFYALIEPYQLLGMEELLDEIVVTFEENYWTKILQDEILSSFSIYIPNLSIKRTEKVKEKNWNEEIEKNTPTINVSKKIGIAPEWKINELDNEIKIIINPKMSFGTGQHSTTKLVAQLMENVVQKGEFWVDAGTGTGVLAILAMKLGASKVFAFDNDDWSVLNAKENFILNDLTHSYTIENIDILNTKLEEANGITANMFVNILDKTYKNFHNSLVNNNGSLIVSGVLIYDKDYIIELYTKNGFDLINILQEDEWVAIHFKAKNL